MTTASVPGRGSAFPVSVSELVPRAREWAAGLDRAPSRNAVMRQFKIGADKAKALLDALTTDTTTNTATNTTGKVTVVGRSATVTTLPRPVGQDTPTTVPGPTGFTQPATPVVRDRSDRAAAVRVGRRVRAWPVVVLALPAFVAIWSGWVGLGGLTGFGVVHPLPGIWDGFAINSAITLPVGMETYAAFALRVWLSGTVPVRARRFARWSAVASLGLGAAGQVAYHLMTAAGMTTAPPWITTVVACLPVAVLGMGAALAHLLHNADPETETESGEDRR